MGWQQHADTRGRRQRLRRRRGNDPAEVQALKTAVHCATVLEHQIPPWRLDRRASTRRALKYRRGEGEIIIVNHDGRGWWDPGDAQTKGDVFSLLQYLEPGLNFGEVRRRLRMLAGQPPTFLEHLRSRPGPAIPVAELWQSRALLRPGSRTWSYLTTTRRLPPFILERARALGVIREGPRGSAWFAHTDHQGRLTGIEMRGPSWRGFSADGDKSLFRLTGKGIAAPGRLAVVEAPIDALSLAVLEGPRADTLYLATAGGIGPETIKALEALLAEGAGRPDACLVAATDADQAGDRYAELLHDLASAAGIEAARLRPPADVGDWNELLVRARAGQARGLSDRARIAVALDSPGDR
ncbi:MAG: DUF3991 domain-containing protein [Parvibaculaceae bacterium]